MERLAAILGDSDQGFTGTEIGNLLRLSGLSDPGPITKRVRISQALDEEQARTGSGVCVAVFLHTAMTPARWIGAHDRFAATRSALNEALAFAGLVLGEDGQLRERAAATTLSEAADRSRRLHDQLAARGAHREVFRYCNSEILRDDCFNAVLEATKGLAERVRDMTGLDLDGHKLVGAAFEGRHPAVAFNALCTDTDRNEQLGLANIMKGVFSAFRNPLTHEPKILWHVREDDALDLLATLSLLHRRLDSAVVLRHVSPGTAP